MEVRLPSRTRTFHFVLRLNEIERQTLNRVAGRLGMSASECMRYLMRRADDEHTKGAGQSQGGEGTKPEEKRGGGRR
jgi:hypothetical protein